VRLKRRPWTENSNAGGPHGHVPGLNKSGPGIISRGPRCGRGGLLVLTTTATAGVLSAGRAAGSAPLLLVLGAVAPRATRGSACPAGGAAGSSSGGASAPSCVTPDPPPAEQPVGLPPLRVEKACVASVFASWESKASSNSRCDMALHKVWGGDLDLIIGLR
jgi:hypothetical protein